ncbi:MAG: DUF1572 family protein [Phycisphaerales bacterium JB043]
MQQNRSVIQAFEEEFVSIRATADAAISQLDADQIRLVQHERTNSVIIIMKHMAGNFCSRFTNFLTEDGEKSWRHRDTEFVDDFSPSESGRQEAVERWNNGWSCVLDALAGLTNDHVDTVVTIRGQPLTVARALARSVAHAGHHTGQIVWLARSIVGHENWNTISIPRGKSDEYNQSLGYTPKH